MIEASTISRQDAVRACAEADSLAIMARTLHEAGGLEAFEGPMPTASPDLHCLRAAYAEKTKAL